jgi:hypothetical protein
MRAFVVLLAGTALLAQEHAPQVQDRNSNRNQDRQRGQTHPPDESQSWTRGRLGTQRPIPGKPDTFNGILIDASCDDRSAYNLSKPPEQPNLAAPPNAERSAPAAPAPPADVAAHHTPDAVTRQPDRSCAVTGATRGYAILTTEGRLLNLDEGGNTLVTQGLHANPEGRAMLNGKAGGIKPRVTLRGRVHGDRLIVDQIVKL